LDSEKRRQFAEFIYKEGTRLEALALHLLDLLVMRKNEFELKECDTKALFYEVKQTVTFLTEKYHAIFRMECEECRVLAEGDLLKTLIYNLVDNGCKAVSDNEQNQKESVILVTGSIEGSNYKVEVKDNGRGIPASEIEKITEAFYMVDKSRARTMGGAGLGLALCQEIAGIHGSGLKITSEEGQGTSVSFYLTVKREEGEEMHE
jgi:signal transduction histidine kinase